MALLKLYEKAGRSAHIENIIGNGFQPSLLENELNLSFGLEERAQAWRCAEELVDAGLLLKTYLDMVAPDKWLIITDAGKDALERGVLDDIDAALVKLSPSFVEMRRGAWRAANSRMPDTPRQAAHSGRELVNQVLQALASNADVLAQPGYQPRPDGKITRRDRYKLVVTKRSRGKSNNDVDLIEKGANFMEAQQKKLDASAHAHEPIERQAVYDALTTVDIILRLMLV
ncbi:hypothetical protein [Agrobacterium vitis]|uniref:pPIWI-associating nuclease domain-containing protein n=1 Tax=Agrobacterium vitis TaxID=373 RepID=UPI00114CE527|nr:hypothetical protein [Agrobacterium vitis]MCM2452060.1 hypothetical protein [Agrobacterium vitis]MCM2469121.1 hypothetical protein [Agrobacterium vitis]MUO69477.1 hypothetical protein [Agrobacterium vitis]MUO87328.1 hypothetical protein [Agrobacterium vitis]